MRPMKTRLLTSTVIPLALAAGVAIIMIPEAPGARANQQVAANPCAAKRGCNPCAAKRACNPCAAKRGCNPCAAKRGCNPCAAKRGCNPCAAKRACNPCNPCNPCAGGAASYSAACVVPRLVAANPCGATRGCNPCAAKRGCNPCAAKRGCNPCAAKRGCNPCAAKRACNPCAAKRACNPCNPCGAAAEVKLSTAEAKAVYNCLKGDMKTAYAKSGNLWAKWFLHWKKFSKQPYVSGTHGGRFVSNYASNKAADSYGKFEKVGKMSAGGILAKDSFTVTPQGRVRAGSASGRFS